MPRQGPRVKPIVKRYKKNPILTKQDVPYPVETVHNAGVVKYQNSYIMLFRSHLRNGRSIIGMAESNDGYSFTVRPKAFLEPASEGIFAEYEEFGLEDPRITHLAGSYLITYSAYSRHGVSHSYCQNKRFSAYRTNSLYYASR